MRHPARQVDRLYSELAGEYGAALERLARAYEANSDKRRDLLQDIHIALWRSLARFDGRCSTRTWVYRVAHNVATSQVIRRKAAAPVFVAAHDVESVADTDDRHGAVDRQRTLDRVYELIRELPPIDRQVMLLYLEEIEAAAIAEVTGLSATNVATRIHRLKRLLARRFHGKGADDE